MNISRRRFIRYLLGGTAITGLSYSGDLWAQSVKGDTLRDETLAPLKEIAVAKKLIFGAATNHFALQKDLSYAQLFVSECDILVPSLELKWNVLRPSREVFQFGPADWMMSFAEKHGIKVRGHTLVWGDFLPSWVEGHITKANAVNMLREHISQVVRHYRGRMHSWDVVNEAVSPVAVAGNRLRENVWTRNIGGDYLEKAFNFAKEADPDCLLVLNDNQMEYDTAKQGQKRTNMLNVLEGLMAKNAPIDAVGIQSHLWGDMPSFDCKKLADFIRALSSLGLKIIISELDVRDSGLPDDLKSRDAMVAERYYEYLSCMLENKSVIAVITWGLSDKYSWYNSGERSNARASRPLPYDAQLRPKECRHSIAKALQEMRPR